MHYPVLKETDLDIRWKVSLKTLRGWRQRNVGPRWHKLLERHVRYHVEDILDFEANALPLWFVEQAA